MGAGASILVLLVAGVASLFMAWVIGAGGSGATPFAPAVGANAISVMRAGFFVGILGLVGAVVQGGNVTQTVGTGLINGVTLTPMAVIVGLLTAAGLMAVGILTGYPIATAFTVTGAIIGAGLALDGQPAWSKYTLIAAVWLLAPVVDGGIAYGLARTLPREEVPERLSIPVLGALLGMVLANVGFSFLGPAGESASLAAEAATSLAAEPTVARLGITLALGAVVGLVVHWDVRRDEERGLRRFLLALGSLVAFSAGGAQVGLAVGPLLPLIGNTEISPTMVLFGGGAGLLVGSWTGAPRMIKSLSQDYSSLGPRRSISALLPSFVMAQVAVFLGVPVSFNEIIVSAIVGSGLAVAGGGVSRAKLRNTVLAWVGSFVLAFAVGFAVLALAT